MLPMRLPIYESTGPPPFARSRKIAGERPAALPSRITETTNRFCPFSAYFPKETPQNLGQIRDDADSPCTLGL